MPSFQRRQPVRFAHCDPAGIVFFPRYLELIDALIEDWTAETIASRRIMHDELGLGLPTVRLETDFVAMSRLGDLLDLTLCVDKIGCSSIRFDVRISCGGEHRLHARLTQTLVRLATRASEPWPPAWRRTIEERLHEPA